MFDRQGFIFILWYGQVVSALAWYSDDSSSILAEVGKNC